MAYEFLSKIIYFRWGLNSQGGLREVDGVATSSSRGSTSTFFFSFSLSSFFFINLLWGWGKAEKTELQGKVSSRWDIERSLQESDWGCHRPPEAGLGKVFQHKKATLWNILGVQIPTGGFQLLYSTPPRFNMTLHFSLFTSNRSSSLRETVFMCQTPWEIAHRFFLLFLSSLVGQVCG